MPHIVIEATAGIAKQIDWDTSLQVVHAALADGGFAPLVALKSRVQVLSHALAGGDVAAEQVVAHITMTQSRSAEAQEAMARIVHQELSNAVEKAAPLQWVQCCVFHRTVPPGTYLHGMWNGPTA